jgi:hypothetical protein
LSKATWKPAKSRECSAWTRAISASGVMPSFSARSMIGVPWVSSAQTYQHSWPRIFWKRVQMSVWMYSTRWPRWIAPLA